MKRSAPKRSSAESATRYRPQRRRPEVLRHAIAGAVAAALAVSGCAEGSRLVTSDAVASTTSTGPPSSSSRSLLVDRAPTPGALPADGTPVVAGVQLPAGRATRTGNRPIWVTDADVADQGALWSSLRRVFPQTGLWPIVLRPLFLGRGHPWWVDGPPVRATDPDRQDTETALRSLWEFQGIGDPDLRRVLNPFDERFPGLAPTPTGRVDDAAPERLAAGERGRIALVPAARPADVLITMAWSNEDLQLDLAPLIAVLRSWEERFGAVLVAVGMEELGIAVRNPPRDDRSATRVAAELYAVCPVIVFWQHRNIGAYGDAIRGKTAWQCEWS
jgi:hypothetical protein